MKNEIKFIINQYYERFFNIFNFKNKTQLFNKPRKIYQLERIIGKKLEPVDNLRNTIGILLEDNKIIGLGLQNCQLKNIRFLELFTDLKSLDLSGNLITDISILKNLTQLEVLDLSFNPEIADYSFLINLKKLTWLDLAYIDFINSRDYKFNSKGIGPLLNDLKRIEYLDLEGNKLLDFDALFLKNLTELTSLNLTQNFLTDVSFLKNLKKITSLRLGWWVLGGEYAKKGPNLDLSFIKEINGLTSIQICDYCLSDISFLKDMEGLVYVDLRHNSIKSLPEWIIEKDLKITTEELEMNFFEPGYIHLFGNAIEYPPIEIVKQGNDLIKRWFEDNI